MHASSSSYLPEVVLLFNGLKLTEIEQKINNKLENDNLMLRN